MTDMYSFKLPGGQTLVIALDWAYVPYYKELQAWILENWNNAGHVSDSDRQWADVTWGDAKSDQENLRRFYKAADRLVKSGTKPKHPIAWALDKVDEFLDEPE